MELTFFAAMAWKSALIAGATLMLAHGLRSRAAADRAMVLRIGVAMLLLLPLIATWLPAIEIVAFAAPETASPALISLPPELQLAVLAGGQLPAPEPTIWDDPTPLVILAYLGGLAMVGSRLLAGLWMLNRWTQRAQAVTCPEWLAAFERVRWLVPNAESVRLLASGEVNSPLSWGWRNPVILIDPDTLGQPDDAEAILAHEVAHIARRDWPVLMLSRLAATLFWFNPLVWLLEREVVQQAEEAADCEAAERVEPARYAETLLSWAQANVMVPANSIAPSANALGRRVKAILDRRLRERPAGSIWTAVAMLLCLAITAPVAAMQLVAAQPPAAPAAPDAPAPPAVPDAPAAPAAPDAPAAPRAPVTIVVDGQRIVIPDSDEITARTERAMTLVQQQLPMIVAAAAIDKEELEKALRDAQVQIHQMPRHDREQVRLAIREARRASSQAQVVAQREVQLALREAQRAQRVAHVSMVHGADGMERGADGMEEGARQMEEQADRFEDPAFREREIARARQRGETVTHEQLLEAAEGLREGAEGMRDGAREMREAAEEMREEHD